MIEQTKSTKLNTSHRPPSFAHQGSLAQVGPCEELENLLREILRRILIFLLQFLSTHSLQKILRKTTKSYTFFLNSGGSLSKDIVAGSKLKRIGTDLRIQDYIHFKVQKQTLKRLPLALSQLGWKCWCKVVWTCLLLRKSWSASEAEIERVRVMLQSKTEPLAANDLYFELKIWAVRWRNPIFKL